MSSKTGGSAILLLAATVAAALLTAGTARGQDQPGADYTDPGKQSAASPSTQLNFHTDLFTGRFRYSYPIAVPPARGDSEPEVSLGYASGGGNGWLGMGWSMEPFCIERDTSSGVPVRLSDAIATYDDAAGFIARLRGTSTKIVRLSPDLPYWNPIVYRAEIDREFMRFEYYVMPAGPYARNTWRAIDKSGTQYIFGSAPETRLWHLATDGWGSTGGNQSDTFGWYLERIIDRNGNETKYSYVKDQAAPTPTVTSNNAIYLDRIDYNGRGSTFTNTVKFNRDAGNRLDVPANCRSGMCQRTRYRLSSIETYVTVSAQRFNGRRYELAYAPSSTTGKSRLASVTEYGSDYDPAVPGTGTSLPPVVFSYSEAGGGWGATPGGAVGDDTLTWSGVDPYAGAPPNQPALHPPIGDIMSVTGRERYGSDSLTVSGFYNINGDALPDRVTRKYNKDGHFLIQNQNRPTTDASGQVLGGTFGPPESLLSSAQTLPLQPTFNSIQCSTGTGTFRSMLVDLDRNGTLDKVEQKHLGPYTRLCVDFDWPSLSGEPDLQNPDPDNICDTSFNIANPVPNTEYLGSPVGARASCVGDGTNTRSGLYDMNGDGRPDWVWAPLACSDMGEDAWFVQLNTGDTSGPDTLFGPALPWGGVRWEVESSIWDSISASEVNTPVVFMDINGDNLPDRVMMELPPPLYPPPPAPDPSDTFAVQLNNGYRFEPLEFWPFDIYNRNTPAWTSPVGRDDNGRMFTSLIDVTGDGLPDRVAIDTDASGPPYRCFKVQPNTGTGFAPARNWSINSQGQLNHISWTAVSYFNNSTKDTQQDLIDIDGDGLKDRVMMLYPAPSAANPVFKVELCRGPLPDLLTQVDGSTDSQVRVRYRSAALYDNTDPATGRGMLPIPMQVVASTTAIDAHSLASTQEVKYDYRGGWFDSAQAEFRGFQQVTQDFVGGTDAVGPIAGTRVVTKFHQGGGIQDPQGGEFADVKKAAAGMPYCVETYEVNPVTQAPSLLKRTISRVETVGLDDAGAGPRRWFPAVTKRIDQDYNGLPNARAVATTFDYDTGTLNVRRVHRHGEVRVNGADLANHTTFEDAQTVGDDTTTVYEYATLGTSPSFDIRDRHSVVKVCPSADAADCPLADSLGWTEMTYTPANGDMLTRTRRDVDVASTESFEYDIYGNVTRQVDAAGAVTTVNYNHFNTGLHVSPERSVSDARPAGATGTFAELDVTRRYDPATGQVVEATNAAGVVTTYGRDRLHRLVDVDVFPEGLGAGKPVINLQERTYSLRGISPSAQNGFTAYQNYQVTRNNDGAGGFAETWTFLDGMGRPIQTWSEFERFGGGLKAWQVSDVVYDCRGHVRFQSEMRRVQKTGNPVFDTTPSSFGTTITCDGLGRSLILAPPPGTETSPTAPSTVAYRDGNDPWAVVTTDPRGNARTMYHNANGQVARIRDEIGRTTTYEYDRVGNLLAIVDSEANRSEFEYDKLGRKRATEDPDSGRWEYQYDAAGRLLRQTDAIGNRTEYDYDHMNRITKQRVFRGSDGTLEEKFEYLYDGNAGVAGYNVYKGQLFAIAKRHPATNAIVSSIANSYDRLGRTLRSDTFLKKNNTTYSMAYEYNDVGLVKRVTYPKGLVIERTYAPGLALKRVESVSGTGPRTVFYNVVNFDRLGRPTRYELGDGKMRTDMSFHSHSPRVNRVFTTVQPAGTALQDITHAWDAGGNLAGITDALPRNPADPTFLALGLESLSYDTLNRLTSYRHTASASTFGFGYDDIGNMTRNDEMGAGAAVDYGYDGSGHVHRQPHAATSANGRIYRYDRNGNMILRQIARTGVPGLVTQTLAYNAGNRLAGVTEPSGLDIAFGYGPDGVRIVKEDRQTGALAVWVGGLFEDRGGKFLNHIEAGGRRVATVQQRPSNLQVATVTGPQPSSYTTTSFRNKTFYLHLNHLQSPVVVTDELGAVVRQVGYSAYGRTFEHVVQATGGIELDDLYTGQALDRETGLYYYQARYYDPELGRFIQPDSLVPDAVNPQGLNRYSYVLNNPLRYTDPTGKVWWVPILVFALESAAEAIIVTTVFTVVQAAMQAIQGEDVTAFDGFGKRLLQAAVRGAVAGAVSGALQSLSEVAAIPGIEHTRTLNEAGEVVEKIGFLNHVLSAAAGAAVYSDNLKLDLKYSVLTSSLSFATDPAMKSIQGDSAKAAFNRMLANGMIEAANSAIYVEVYKPGEFGHDSGRTFLAGFKNGAIAGGVKSAFQMQAKDGSTLSSIFTLPGSAAAGLNIDLSKTVTDGITNGLQGDMFELKDTPEAPDDPTGDGSGHGT